VGRGARQLRAVSVLLRARATLGGRHGLPLAGQLLIVAEVEINITGILIITSGERFTGPWGAEPSMIVNSVGA
jgi:hypothetical protein